MTFLFAFTPYFQNTKSKKFRQNDSFKCLFNQTKMEDMPEGNLGFMNIELRRKRKNHCQKGA